MKHTPKPTCLNRCIRSLVMMGIISSSTAIAHAQTSMTSSASNSAFRLTLLHNNDGESALVSSGDFAGVARFVTLVHNLQNQALQPTPLAAGVVTVSSGDNYIAGPQFNASLETGKTFFDAIAMDQVGYSAICLGNHDFDFGPDVLASFIAAFNKPAPFLSSNLDFRQEPKLQAHVDSGRIAASTVIETGGDRVAIIGATTEELPYISSPRNVIVNNAARAIQSEIDRLQNNGINKIIVISHLQGISNGEQEIAPKLRGVDVLVAGGGDELLANPHNVLIPGDEKEIFGPYPLMVESGDGIKIPVITTSGHYRYVGRLVVDFDAGGHVVNIDQLASGPIRVAGGNNPDAVIEDATTQASAVDPVKRSVDALATKIVGHSEVVLDGLRAHVRTRETNEGNLAADGMLSQARKLADQFNVKRPDIAFLNGGGIRNDTEVPAGNISELDTFSMLPFPNFIAVVPNIPRAQLKEIMENAVSKVEGAAGRFAQIAGFKIRYDISQPAQVLDDKGNVITVGQRIRFLALNDGRIIVANGNVVDGDTVTIATLSFLANGGDQYPFRGASFVNIGISYQQAMKKFIQSDLAGTISKADYPEGGEGRIVQIQPGRE